MRQLDVSVGGVPTGQIWEDGDSFGFRLVPSYLNSPRRNVLGQWFEDRLDKKHTSRRQLHPWFRNLLPERGTQMRGMIAQRGGLGEDDDFGLLSLLGRDLPGSVVVTPSDPTTDLPLLVESADAVGVPHGLRSSLGGMQLKLTLSGSAPDRLVLGVREGEVQWILKLATAAEHANLPQNEAAIMGWCAAAGFLVPEHRVVDRDELPSLFELPDTIRHGFLIRRYDRTKDGRIHQEDFAQVFACAPAEKYARTDSAGLGLRVGEILGAKGLAEFVRRLVVTIATGNCDAHLKNWSLLYPGGQRATWTPLYDQVATIMYPSLATKLALRIGGAKHLHEVQMCSFIAMHSRWTSQARSFEGWAGIDVQSLIIETIDRMRSAFDPEALQFPEGLEERLRRHWDAVPLLKAQGLTRT